MAWFDDLKQALPAYYPPTGTPTIVGYLRGSIDPNFWRSMERAGRHEMLILGSRPPNHEDWVAAGVAARGADQIVTISNLIGFIVLYGGLVVTQFEIGPCPSFRGHPKGGARNPATQRPKMWLDSRFAGCARAPE
jgi:hypothetical protein